MAPPPRRAAPAAPPPAPARAWLESEAQRHLLAASTPRRAAPTPPPGLTLAVWPAPHTYLKCPTSPHQQKRPKQISLKKRIEHILAVLKPPYFIIFMIIIMVCVQWGGGGAARAALQWRRRAWWQQPWRALTYSCVHAGSAHLALNAIVALAVGWRLEAEQGHWRAAALWWGGAAAGALAAGALQPAAHVVGASAAVYALLTAHLANVCLRFGHIPLWWFRPLSVCVLGASEASWAGMRAAAGADARVAWSAHALGAALGLPLAFLVFTGENSAKRYILVCRVVSAVVIAGGVVLCGAHYGGLLDGDY